MGLGKVGVLGMYFHGSKGCLHYYGLTSHFRGVFVVFVLSSCVCGFCTKLMGLGKFGVLGMYFHGSKGFLHY